MDTFIRDYQNEEYNTKTIESIHDLNKNIIGHNFRLFQMNIRSIRKNFDELIILLETTKQCYEAIILTETFHVANPDLYNIPGYNIIYNNGGFNKNEGVIIYIKKNINYEYKTLKIHDMNLLDVDIITVNGENLKSPGTSLASFNIEMSTYLQNIDLNVKHIIAGDISVNLVSDDNYVEEYKNILSSYGFISAGRVSIIFLLGVLSPEMTKLMLVSYSIL